MTNWDAARAAQRRPLRKPYKPVAPVGNDVLNRTFQDHRAGGDGATLFVMPTPITAYNGHGGGDRACGAHGHTVCFTCYPPKPAVKPCKFCGSTEHVDGGHVPRSGAQCSKMVPLVATLVKALGKPPRVAPTARAYWERPPFVYYRDISPELKDTIELASRREGFPLEVGAPSSDPNPHGFVGVWTGETYLTWTIEK